MKTMPCIPKIAATIILFAGIVAGCATAPVEVYVDLDERRIARAREVATLTVLSMGYEQGAVNREKGIMNFSRKADRPQPMNLQIRLEFASRDAKPVLRMTGKDAEISRDDAQALADMETIAKAVKECCGVEWAGAGQPAR